MRRVDPGCESAMSREGPGQLFHVYAT